MSILTYIIQCNAAEGQRPRLVPCGGKNTSIFEDRKDRRRDSPSPIAAGREAFDAALEADACYWAEVPRVEDHRQELDLANHVPIGFRGGGHCRGIQKEDRSNFKPSHC